MSDNKLRHEFVEFIPRELEQGVLYISILHTSAIHLCACGCGLEVVTPIRPTEWKLLFDGETVSLKPSIGNEDFPCESHYWIENDRIRWVPKKIKGSQQGRGDRELTPSAPAPNIKIVIEEPERVGFLRRLLGKRRG